MIDFSSPFWEKIFLTLELLTPGIIIFSISAITSSHLSGVWGASSGSNGFIYPGLTVGRTCLKISKEN